MAFDLSKPMVITRESAAAFNLPAVMNSPPSGSQKDSMRKSWLSGQIVMRICKLIIQNNISSIILSRNHLDAATESISGISGEGTLEEFIAYIQLGKRFLIDNQHLVDALFWEGIPVIINQGMDDSIHYLLSGDDKYRALTIASQVDAMNLLVEGSLHEQALFSFLYLSDVNRLINEQRDRGQSLVRYLPIFANPKINERIYQNFHAPQYKIRMKMLDGLDFESLDYPTLLKIFEEVRKDK